MCFQRAVIIVVFRYTVPTAEYAHKDLAYAGIICTLIVTGCPEPKLIQLDFINFKDRIKGITYVALFRK
jgi:hypothetical protein